MKLTPVLIFLFMNTASFAQLKPVTYHEGKQVLHGLAIKPVKENKGGVLILPAWKGIDESSKNVAERLSNLGYYAFIADIYGEGNYPKDSKEAGERSSYYKKNYSEYRQRISLAWQELLKTGADPAKIVVIGYCFGGTGALEAARTNLPVKGVVSFHGGLARDASREVVPIKPKVLVCHGADDPSVPQAQVQAFQQEMRDAKADWQMIFYSNAVHAFTDKSTGNDNAKGAAYNELADKRSWQHFMDFLHEVLTK
jgi:dienelactone hydrolase